jgi:FKBP-type peptidyl-prolyl cis-trans isomerase
MTTTRSQRGVTMSKPFLFVMASLMMLLLLQSASFSYAAADKVRVETISPGEGPAVTKDYKYSSMVTLYIEEGDGTKTPSGWSTRVSDGAAADNPFEFQPGVGLIQGWTDGVLQMKEGERAWLHVPSSLGYGSRPMGSPGGAFYIPADSNLLFDIEILSKAGESEL